MLNSMLRSAKRTVKARHAAGGPIVRRAVSALSLPWKAALTAQHILFNANYRSIVRLRLFNSGKVHQTSSFTSMDRYPVIFSACRDYFPGKKELNLLSYGCSTGEEAATLRKYFPEARIVGAEINKHSLAQCRARQMDDRVRFIYSSPDEIRKHGPYDAIFCMAVLQRRPHRIAAGNVTSLAAIYPFERFEETIALLDSLVRPQGLLVIHFTQYSLMDTNVASGYEILGDYNQHDYLSPTFDANSRIVPGRAPLNTIFIKRGP